MERKRIFDPLEERENTPLRTESYPYTFERTPDTEVYDPHPKMADYTGPGDVARRLPVGHGDMSVVKPGGTRAMGQLIHVFFRVVDEDGKPIPDAIMEMWHANSAGKYTHKSDVFYDAPIDPNFIGQCRVQTDAKGEFRLASIKPAAYPSSATRADWRAPHIHISIVSGYWKSRLVTQMFFPGEPLNEQDALLNTIPSPAARQRLIAEALPVSKGPGNALVYGFEIVMRGRNAPTDHVEATK